MGEKGTRRKGNKKRETMPAFFGFPSSAWKRGFNRSLGALDNLGFWLKADG
jgi:hypothetical protein